MINANYEILYRDCRTAISLPRIVRGSCTKVQILDGLCESCDNCQSEICQIDAQSRRIQRKTRKFSNNLLHYLILVISVIIISSPLIEAKPLNRTKLFKFACGGRPSTLSTSTMNATNLKLRLKTIIDTCEDALLQTKELTEEYIKILWKNESVDDHHKTWKNEQLSWLHPDGVPLKKQFHERIEPSHRIELESIVWNSDKIFDYLGKIYQRLERIYVGVQIVNKWIDVARRDGQLMNPAELNASVKLFNNVTSGIDKVLCEIQDLFRDVSINPKTDVHVEPFKIDNFIKMNHWLIYREYANLMDYSSELLNIINERFSAENGSKSY